MPEERKDVVMIHVNFKCPDCIEGYLYPTGEVLQGEIPRFMYEHKCVICGYVQNFYKVYPFMESKEIN